MPMVGTIIDFRRHRLASGILHGKHTNPLNLHGIKDF